MQIELTLALPRDTVSVPVARRVCTEAMEALGVDDDCAHDIEIALTEACTNVLEHVADGDEYAVAVHIGGTVCVIEVTDTGRGFDHVSLHDPVAEPTAERGRGLAIMNALVDRVRFTSRSESGTICHLEKALVWTEDAPARELTDDAPAPAGGA
jgi:serine/threonine-protein kinase RsbW